MLSKWNTSNGLYLTSQKGVLQFFQVATRIFMINPHPFLLSIWYTFSGRTIYRTIFLKLLDFGVWNPMLLKMKVIAIVNSNMAFLVVVWTNITSPMKRFQSVPLELWLLIQKHLLNSKSPNDQWKINMRRTKNKWTMKRFCKPNYIHFRSAWWILAAFVSPG